MNAKGLLNGLAAVPFQEPSSFPLEFSKNSSSLWQETIATREEFLLFYRLIHRTIQSVMEKKYTRFDAHTTFHSCLTMTGFVLKLIDNLDDRSLKETQNLIETKIEQLEQIPPNNLLQIFPSWLPMQIFELVSLYALTFVGENAMGFEKRAFSQKLQKIAPVSNKFCQDIISKLQRHFFQADIHIYLSDFLPYNPDIKKKAILSIALKEYQMLLTAALDAFRCFRKGELERFDSLVGENACQIRAIWIARLASQKSNDFINLENRISAALKKIENCLLPKSLNFLMLNRISLKELLEKENLDIPLNTDESFLVLSYFLTEAKIVPKTLDNEMPSFCRNDIVSDSKRLKNLGDVSRKFCDNLLSKLRTYLSFESVQFIREAAMNSKNAKLIKMSSEDFIIKHNDCFCSPVLWSIQSILLMLKKMGVPILIHAKFIHEESGRYIINDEAFSLYEASLSDEGNFGFIERELSNEDLDKAAFVIQGIVYVKDFENFSKDQWKMAMKEFSVEEIILAAGAHHRQYPNEEMDVLIDVLKDEEFEHYKTLATEKGFSLENPTRFFVQHIYTTQVKNVVIKDQIIKENLGIPQEYANI